MKKSFLVLYLLFATITFAFSQSMDWQYATQFGGTNKVSGSVVTPLNHPHHLELDNEGNAYIFGTYGDYATFYGASDGLDFDSPSFADKCAGAFVAKFDCNGNVVWHKAIAREKNISHEAQYMVMKGNRLYLQGTIHIPIAGSSVWFLDTLVYGSDLINNPEDNAFPWIPNNYYTYIMELDLDGNIIDYNLFSLYKEDIYGYNGEPARKRTYNLFASEISKTIPFAIDNQYNYYIIAKMNCNGYEYSPGNRIPQKMVFMLNGEDITDTIMPEDNQYIYHLLKFDQNFNIQYDKSIIESINPQYYWSFEVHFYDMKCDSEDNIYLAGYIQIHDTAANPPYPYDVELADDKHIYIYNDARHGIVMKVSNSGEILWVNQARNYGRYGKSDFQDMLLDENSGNIYVSGFAWSVAPLYPDNYTIFGENDTLVNSYSGDHANIVDLTDVIVCYDTGGNYKWYSCPLTTGCNIGGVAIYNDKLYAGVLWSSFGLVLGDTTYYPSEQYHFGYSICEWDQQGNMTDVKQIYCKVQDQTSPYDTRINALGEIYIAGRFDNKMAFAEDTIIAQFETDMFIAKFGYSCPTYIYDTATYCYGDVVQGVTLTASGDYTFAYPEGGQEFDSIVLVHATVLPPLTIGLNDTTVCTAQQFYLDACGDFDSYQWSTGGTGCTEMLQFDNACTQSVSLTVTRGECSATRTISITAQVCDGITEPTATAMSLYPNPANDIVSIFGDGFLSATVIDINGRIVLQTTAMQLDLSSLRPGEYVVKVERLNGETEELKLVKE